MNIPRFFSAYFHLSPLLLVQVDDIRCNFSSLFNGIGGSCRTRFINKHGRQENLIKKI